MIEDLEHGVHSAGLSIFRSVNQAANSCKGYSARAHRAGLNRHVEIAVEQAIVPDGRSGLPQRKDLGVCRGIVGGERAVASPAHDSSLAHYDRSYGNLAQRQRTLRFTERFLHPESVGKSHGDEANAATSD